MDEAHPMAIPVDQHQDLSFETPSNQSEIVNAPYKEAIGSFTVSSDGFETRHRVCNKYSQPICREVYEGALERNEENY